MAAYEDIRIGDRVRISEGYGDKSHTGMAGTVVDIDPAHRIWPVAVRMDAPQGFDWIFEPEELDVIKDIVTVEEAPC
jgi:hypothetical protein